MFSLMVGHQTWYSLPFHLLVVFPSLQACSFLLALSGFPDVTLLAGNHVQRCEDYRTFSLTQDVFTKGNIFIYVNNLVLRPRGVSTAIHKNAALRLNTKVKCVFLSAGVSVREQEIVCAGSSS